MVASHENQNLGAYVAKDEFKHFSHDHSLCLVYLQQQNPKNENDSDEDEDRDEEVEKEFVEENLHGGECNMCKEQILSFDVCHYYCKPCDYSLHKFCAELPEIFQNHPLHPQHELSLVESDYYSNISGKIHKNFKDDEHPNLLHCPFDNEGDNLLRRHMSGKIELTGKQHDADTLNHSCHHHPLILFNKQTSDGEKTVSLHNPMKKIQQLCDGCVKPITTVPFYECNRQADEQCCFILHEWCAKLPLKLQDYTGHPEHTLFLLPKVPSKFFSVFTCAICDLPSNGFAYGCMMCEFYIDINCAFIPEEIIHDAHPGHLLYKICPSNLVELCNACFTYIDRWGFRCPSCDFYIHVGCALLLYRVIKHKCDKHPLSLRYEPMENHISDYFCEICEDKLNPWKWFYHCTTCRQSTHTACVPLIAQYEQATDPMKIFMTCVYQFLNVKFGETLKIKGHPHRLTFVQGIPNDGTCFECGDPLFEGNMIFKCLECEFRLHYECASSLTID
ncbi:hypothetical protein E3N88_41071 [Mikania micrantha]|uniref:Phorbol-ester/DAG-type domain-containing protein n=1 Tax=Mikania micrantha TaxID=192012 RepID=A0A5N6LPI6_9ASTR|nr:hypothetical protein E3N88_41071 [Mikania micrantha]